MNMILNRDEFVLEIDKFNRGDEVNEGLFQFLKSFFKRDWKDIKSNNVALKNALEDIDKSLDGFTVLKRSNYDACSQFRQALCDFANDLLDGKLEELEDGKSLKKVVMGVGSDEDKMKTKMNQSEELTSILGKNSIKSKSLREKLQDSAEAVDNVIKSNIAIAPWANAMKRSVKNLINDIIIQKSDDDDKETIEKAVANKKKEDEKWLKKQNDLGFKSQDEKIKEIEDERKKTLENIGITPLKNVDGEKALVQLKGEFDKLIKPLIKESLDNNDVELITEAHKSIKTLQKMFENDKNFGFPEIIKIFTDDASKFKNIATSNYDKKDSEDDDKFISRIQKRVINIYFGELNEIYNKIKTLKRTVSFKDVPGDAIQAMYAGIALAVGYGLTGKTFENYFLSEDTLNLMTKCCIEKDATIGYSFPLLDDKKPDEGTIFVGLMKVLSDAKNETGIFNKKTDAKLLNNFKTNISTLFKKILKNAEEIKEKDKEQKEKEAEALKKKEKDEDK